LANYSSESNKMSANLAKKENQLLDLEKSLQDTKAQNDKLSSDLKEREKRVAELEAVLKKKDAAVNDLKTKVTNALLAFNDKDLTVNVKNGKVYVSLSEQLLFKSGSTEIDKKGKDAIKKLASVLKTNDDVNVMVEGHTDDVPVNKGSAAFSDNWDLSVLRATQITRILIENEVNPQKVIPAGRSEFVPIAEGKTPEIRQKNRRTEIILTPKLDELFKILEDN
jgi:chemotaxis protein MotB